MNNHDAKQRRDGSRLLAILLALALILTSVQMPVSAATAPSVSLVTKEITTETTSVDVDITNLPDSGILRVIQLDAGDSFDSAKLNNYTSLNFSLLANLSEGSNTLELSPAPAEGKQIMAVLRDSSGSGTSDYTTAVVTVKAPAQEPSDPEEDPKEEPGSELSISINGEVTTSAKEIPIRITGDLPDGAVISIRGYVSSHTDIDYSSAWLGNENYNFNIGTLLDATADATSVQVTGGDYLAPGMQLVAYVIDGGSTVAYSDIVLVKGTGSLSDRAESILQNCSVKLLADGDIALDTTKIGVKVGLDAAVESCTLTIYELPQNIAFDSDTAAFFTSLWSGTVSDGYEETVLFREGQLPLKAYHKLVAVLNVPIDTSGDGFYRTKESDAVYILDENGERFKNYEYPNIRIDEETLEAGATSLHLTLTGDERLFEAARDPENKDFQINYALGMYPDGEEFDFEGSNQIALLNYQSATEAFSGKEVTFDTPLKEGYRVRAVVYWSQDESLFVAKGNDYEEMFNMPDDSVLVTAVSNDPKVTLPEDIYEGDTSLEVTIGGEIPDGSMLLIKSFDKNTTEYASDKGTSYGMTFNVESGKMTAQLNDVQEAGPISAGQRMVGFLLNAGNVIAQSDPIVVKTVPAPTLTISGKLKAGTQDVSVVLDGKVPDNAKLFLFKFNADATSYTRSDGTYLANMNSGVKAGTNTFSNVELTAGEKVAAFLLDGSYNDVAKSDPVRIIDPATELVVSMGEVRTDSTDVTVNITGAIPEGAVLLVKSYPAATKEFATDQGTPQGVTNPIQNGDNVHKLTAVDSLRAGQELVAFVLLSGDPVAQSDPVVIEQGAYEAPTIRILDKELTAGDVKLHYEASFDKAISSAECTLFKYTGESFDPAAAEKVLSSNLTKSTGSSGSMFYIGGKIQEGDKLILALKAQDETVYSDPITVEPSPAWGGVKAGFDVESLRDDATTIPVHVDYSDEYLKKYGDDFYCDVTVYMFDRATDDDMFEQEELWEKSGEAKAVAKANSKLDHDNVTKGNFEIPLYSGAELEAGKKLIIKVRLPHTEWVDEWDDEEEDFFSSSIPVTPASEFAFGPSVLLYNVDFTTPRGETIRKLLEENNIRYKVLTKEDFVQKIGYLVEEKGYEKSEQAWDGEDYSSEFMLMHAADQDLWDETFRKDGGFIDIMRENGVAIDLKASSTPTNKQWVLGTLIGDIMEEHEVMTAWVALNKVKESAETVDETTFGGSANWADFKAALEAAEKALLTKEEDGLTAELLQNANDKLSEEMRKLTADSATTEKLTEDLKNVVKKNGAFAEETYRNSVNWQSYQEALEKANALLKEDEPNAGALKLAAALLEREANNLTAGSAATEELKMSIEDLAKEESSYPEETYGKLEGWKEYQEALDNVKALLEEEDTPAAARLEKAKLALENSIAALKDAYEKANSSSTGTDDKTGSDDKTGTDGKTGSGGKTGSEATGGNTAKTNLKGASVKLAKNTYSYTGKAIKPSVTVALGKKTLKKNTDYTVSYKNNKKVGKATITIKGKGSYSGSLARTFTINPKATKLKKVTKGKKQATAAWKKQAKEVTGYQLQYATDKKFKKNVKKVTVKKAKTTKRVIKKLKSGKTYYVRIRTYKKVGGKTYYSGWSKAKKVKVK